VFHGRVYLSSVRYTGTSVFSFTATALNSGSVSQVTVVNGGSGLTSTPNVYTDPPDSNNQAPAVAVVSGGAVTAITATNGSSGYASHSSERVLVG
jgi:hypothetical protein